MPLPALIEIVPWSKPVHATVTVPGSKSITNRTLVLAALAAGDTTLRGALWSEDTQVMVESLQRLGFTLTVEAEAQEASNRTITVQGRSGQIPNAGTLTQPLELFVGNAGTATRFLSALVCLGQGVYRLSGVPRMHERPQRALFAALRQLGYQIDSPTDKLPVVIHGRGPRPGVCQVSIAESSQFASALLLPSRLAAWQVKVADQSAEEAPYVQMTRELIDQFPGKGGEFQVEPDASSGSYFVAADFLAQRLSGLAVPFRAGRAVSVPGWPSSAWQIDASFPKFLPLPPELSRERDLGDSIMTAMALAPFAAYPVRFTELGRLRVQECERVVAMRSELTKCGARVVEQDDTLTVSPSELHGAEIETYNDHRVAMCFAILGLKVPGLRLKNPACVKKTFPNFFQKLAAVPPLGLGVSMIEPKTGRLLSSDELV